MRITYSLVLYLCLPLVFGYFFLRGLRESGYLRGWRQRMGFGLPGARGCLCVHAASLGEVNAAAPLVQALVERYPQWPLVVTTFTPAGRARATALFGGVAQALFAPLDLPGAVRRFRRRTRPRLLVVMETEIWPNLVGSCAAAGIPIVVVNARLSENALHRYRHPVLRGLFRAAFANLTAVAAASAADGARFAAAGTAPERIQVTGNLKFDLRIPAGLTEQGWALRERWQAGARPVWIAASTHAGEEAMILDAWSQLRQRYPNLLLILAPRHPYRFAMVAELLAARGLACAKRSGNDRVDAGIQVVLGDTLGELLLLFAVADLAFVGGSLVPGIGGHNLLEPAALGLPLTTGTHLVGWHQVATWLERAGALRRVADSTMLAQATARHLDDPAARRRAGQAGAAVVARHRGALQRNMELLAPLVGN